MVGYQIWNGTDDIYTPGGPVYTAEQWKEMYPWVKLPGVKMIITKPPINGGVALEFTSTVDMYKSMGVEISDDMTDEEICELMSNHDNTPVQSIPTSEDRIAASLEAQTLLNSLSLMGDNPSTLSILSDSESKQAQTNKNSGGVSPAYIRINENYKNGLWSDFLVNLSVVVGHITEEEAEQIIGG